MAPDTAVTFHKADATLACDICGSAVDSSDRGRQLHTAWHRQADEVIDLTTKHELKLAEAS